MKNKKEQDAWDEIKDVWNESSEGKEIKIAMNQLVTELKHWTSPFEQNTIKNDIAFIKNAVSQFEKESIKKDIAFIKRNTSQFEKNFAKKIIRFFTKVLKRVLSIIKRGKK